MVCTLLISPRTVVNLLLSDNQTRFLIVGHLHHPALPTIRVLTKVLVRFSITDEVSSLFSIVTSSSWLNKLKIERIDRRPDPSFSPWTDLYLIEFTRSSSSSDLKKDASTLVGTLDVGMEARILGVW